MSRKRRLHDPFLPLVILTASDEEQDRMKGHSLGANSYVQKPVEFGAFIKAVWQ